MNKETLDEMYRSQRRDYLEKLDVFFVKTLDFHSKSHQWLLTHSRNLNKTKRKDFSTHKSRSGV